MPKHKLIPARSTTSERLQHANGTELAVEYVKTLDLTFHSKKEVQVTLERVSYLPSLKVNTLSLHTIQVGVGIILDSAGVI